MNHADRLLVSHPLNFPAFLEKFVGIISSGVVLSVVAMLVLYILKIFYANMLFCTDIVLSRFEVPADETAPSVLVHPRHALANHVFLTT